MKVILKIKNGNSMWFDIYQPIERTEQELEEYAKAVKHLAETKSELIFDTVDYNFENSYECRTSLNSLQKYFDIEPIVSFDYFVKFIGDGKRIPNEHFELKYICLYGDGDDNDYYIDKKCRNCKCAQVGFIVDNVFYKTEKLKIGTTPLDRDKIKVGATQLDRDKLDLQLLYKELQWKQDAVNRMERAVEFGRCKKCKQPLMHGDKEYCGDYPNCEF